MICKLFFILDNHLHIAFIFILSFILNKVYFILIYFDVSDHLYFAFIILSFILNQSLLSLNLFRRQ